MIKQSSLAGARVAAVVMPWLCSTTTRGQPRAGMGDAPDRPGEMMVPSCGRSAAARSAGRRSAAEHGHPGGIAMIERYVLGLEEIDGTQVALAGGKGAHLGELSRIEGIRVPAGFCVTTDAFRRIMTMVPGIDDRLDRLSRVDPGDQQAIRTLSAEIRGTL